MAVGVGDRNVGGAGACGGSGGTGNGFPMALGAVLCAHRFVAWRDAGLESKSISVLVL